MSGKHGPNRLSNYQQTHEKRMWDFLLEGFVLEEDLRFEDLGNDRITLTGHVRCLGGVDLEVEKLLAVLGGSGPSAMVQAVAYRYHATLTGRAPIFRYENSDHRGYDHVHRYDTLGTGAEVSAEPQRIDNEEDVPTLSEVLDELREWYCTNIEALDSG